MGKRFYAPVISYADEMVCFSLNPPYHFPDIGAFVETWIGVPKDDMISITNMD